MSTARTELVNERRGEIRQRLPRLLFLAGILLLATWFALKTYRLARLAQSFRQHQAVAEVIGSQGLLNADPQTAQQLVLNLRRDVVLLDREVRPFLPLISRLGWIPRIGPLLAQSEPLLDMADSGSEAAAYSVRGLTPALELLQSEREVGDPLLPQLMPVLQNAEPDLVAASAALDRAIEARGRIDDLETFPWRVRSLLEAIDGKLYLADELKLLAVLPQLMGIDGPRTYLILAQNEDEIRPTGGFLTGAGLLTVDRGQIVQLSFQDGNVVDDWRNKPYDLPPDPLYRLMGLELFLFRDANFWPDFPTSAEQAMQLYRYGQDAPPLDGAIAIDQRFVAMLLAVSGPVNVPQLETSVSSGNLVASMRDAWGVSEGESHREWVGERKDFLGPLAAALQSRLLGNLDAIDPLFLAETLHRAAQEKHLQIYVHDPQVGAVLDQIDWDGRLEFPSSGDYFMVVDTNVGFNKANVFVESAISYNVELSADGSGMADLSVRYTHTGTESSQPCEQIVPYVAGITYDALVNRCYWNYTRIYVPGQIAPISLVDHELQPEMRPVGGGWQNQQELVTQDTSGSTIIGDSFVLPRGQQLTSEYTYSLPVVVSRDGTNTYRLAVKKQAGITSQQLAVRIVIPDGASVVESSPGATIDGRVVTFETELVTDLSFEVSYRFASR